MKPKLAATSALVAYVAGRSLRLVTILFFTGTAASLTVIGLLAYFFSEWWWLLAAPVIVAVIIFMVIRFVAKRIISAIHRHPFTARQREQLEAFTKKLRSLVANRSTPIAVYAAQTVRDILRDHDATTVRKVVTDTTSLKDDFAELEKQFGER